MMEIRAFEDKVFELLARNILKGASHVYAGQEAVAVGACSAITDRDYVTSTHRGHGHCLALGADLKRMMAELCGKATGYCKGRGGSMHIADVASRNLGATGIVGGNLPVATGAGLAIQMQGKDAVCLCFFGDGASNEGNFHESLNMAGKWRLPVIYICENNLYGMSVAFERAAAVNEVASRAPVYAMPGVAVDGQRVLEVRDAVLEAAERARRGGGPTLIEAKTYRYRGHSRSDPRVYRTKEEEAYWQERDPITLFRDDLIGQKLLTNKAFEKLQAVVDRAIAAAETFAVQDSPYPDPSEVLDDVYCGWIETDKGLVRTETKG
ncbi:MAG: acetoin:2,6-dichlorophenolindophenol oxidoreductase subunit alpha [Planctomycetes bacterium SM23_25]|nr:MAG: acetoin:2,6-dichlorophenolindophenol oxidoreductase subunit alpha [Planctomycetes bacterium SM23_25]